MVSSVVSFLNKPWLVAVVTGLFLFGIARTVARR